MHFSSWPAVLGLATILLLRCGGSAASQDVVEFLNGTTLAGKVLQIRTADREFDFESQIGGQSLTRTYPYGRVHAVTIQGKRHILTPRPEAAAAAPQTSTSPLSEAEVQSLIDRLGSAPPEWLESTPLNHPQTLDLDWPLKAEGPWNESRNVGQYIWGRVNPNEARWRSGIKLVLECLRRHTGDAALVQRDMEKLGAMYFELLQDYPRAAYWFQQARVPPSTALGVHLAECYWRLGSKQMALDYLGSGPPHLAAIKLYGDLGEIEQALELTASYERSGQFNEAFLAAGDALRGAGRYKEAIDYYQRVLDRNQARNAEYLQRFRARADDGILAIRLFEDLDIGSLADGTYRASARAYNGPLEVEVRVAQGLLQDIRVTRHQEKQFYAALKHTPQQILQQQGLTDVDGTSGATITSQAIVAATAKALASQREPD